MKNAKFTDYNEIAEVYDGIDIITLYLIGFRANLIDIKVVVNDGHDYDISTELFEDENGCFIYGDAIRDYWDIKKIYVDVFDTIYK